MKKYLIILLGLILAACSGGAEVLDTETEALAASSVDAGSPLGAAEQPLIGQCVCYAKEFVYNEFCVDDATRQPSGMSNSMELYLDLWHWHNRVVDSIEDVDDCQGFEFMNFHTSTFGENPSFPVYDWVNPKQYCTWERLRQKQCWSEPPGL